MKKRLNYIIFAVGMFLTIAIPFKNVYAKHCEYGMPTPPIYYNGSWSKGQTIKYTTTASSCRAENISVYFSDGAYLPLSKIEIEAWLMEDDVDPNEDDVAKKYSGTNTTIKDEEPVYDWTWNVDYVSSSNLDSAGDQVCELYVKFRMIRPIVEVGYYEEDMLRYTVCVE